MNKAEATGGPIISLSRRQPMCSQTERGDAGRRGEARARESSRLSVRQDVS